MKYVVFYINSNKITRMLVIYRNFTYITYKYNNNIRGRKLRRYSTINNIFPFHFEEEKSRNVKGEETKRKERCECF